MTTRDRMVELRCTAAELERLGKLRRPYGANRVPARTRSSRPNLRAREDPRIRRSSSASTGFRK